MDGRSWRVALATIVAALLWIAGSAGGALAQDTTLRVAMGSPGDAGIRVWDDIATQFEAAHPGVDVEMNYQEDDLYQTIGLPTLLAGPNAPDVYFEWTGSRMAQRAADNEKIRFAFNSAVTAIHGDGKVSGVTLTDTVTGRTRRQDAGGLFVAIGHLPRTELVAGQVDLDEAGYIKVDSPTTVTNLRGVFACGDAVDHRYRQAITAAGTGCAAALDAERYLAALEDSDSIATALVEEGTHG